MIGGHRVAILALLAVCAAAWVVVPVRTAAEAQPVVPPSPEPPLVESVGPGPASAVVDPPPPVVTVRVRVPARGAAGQELTYRILVENTARSPAHHVAVRAGRPTNANFERATPRPEQEEPELRWAFGTLEGGASKEITLVVTPDGKGEVQTTARVSFEHGQSVVTHLNRPSLRLRKVGPREAAVKSVVTYVLEVTNDGSAAAENVVVTDVLPDGLGYSETRGAKEVDEKTRRWEFPGLAPGQTRRIEYTVIPAREGRFKNTATAAAQGVAAVEATAELTAGQPKLSVAKTGPAVGDPGQPLTYTLTIANTGGVAANNVEIVDQIPQARVPQTGGPAVEFLGATQGGRYERPAVRWPVGRLPPNATRTVQLTLRVNQLGRLNNVAEARADQVPPEKAEALTVLADPAQPVYLDLERPQDTLEVGGKPVYVVRVINTSKTAPVEGASLTFSASDNVRFLAARGATEGTPDKDRPLVRFAPAKLGPRQVAEYFITLEATQAGVAEFHAAVDANPPLPGRPARLDVKVPVGPARP